MKIISKNKQLNKEGSISRKKDNELLVYKEFACVGSLGLEFCRFQLIMYFSWEELDGQG